MNASDLKMMYCMIRTPRLCDMFHKAMREKTAKEKRQKIDVESMMYLQPKIQAFSSEKAFVENFAGFIGRAGKAEVI